MLDGGGRYHLEQAMVMQLVALLSFPKAKSNPRQVHTLHNTDKLLHALSCFTTHCWVKGSVRSPPGLLCKVQNSFCIPSFCCVVQGTAKCNSLARVPSESGMQVSTLASSKSLRSAATCEQKCIMILYEQLTKVARSRQLSCHPH